MSLRPLLLTLLLLAAGADAQTPAVKSALTVVPVAPQREQWAQAVPAAGEVAAWQESIIGSEVGAQRIVELRAQVGDRVRKGALLARIADDSAAADLAQAQAALAEADALLGEARANAERARSLRDKGFYSAQQLVQYETAQTAAQARRAAAAAAVQSAQVRLAQTRILAPDDGIISARSAAVGSLTTPGQELFRLIRQGRLEWRAEVPEAKLAGIAIGQPARITTAAGGTATGKVRTVAPSIDVKTRNAVVYVDLVAGKDLAAAPVRAGMFVRGEIELGRGEVLTIPQNALVLRDGFAYAAQLEAAEVAKVGAGGTAKVRLRKLELGRRQGERVAVLGGLAADALIVASGAAFLADGDTVRVEQASASAAAPSTGVAAK